MSGLSIPPKNTILDKSKCLMCGKVMNLHFTHWSKLELKFVKVCNIEYANRTGY